MVSSREMRGRCGTELRGAADGEGCLVLKEPEPTTEPRALKRLSFLLGAAFVLVYLGWALWFASPLLFRDRERPGAFDGIFVAVPGFPWSFVLGAIGVPLGAEVVGATWVANAGLAFWYGTICARWLGPRCRRWRGITG